MDVQTTEFDRETIIAALTEVGEELHRRRKVGDVAVFGGSAMLLQFGTEFVTRDVDAVIDAEHGEVTRAVQEVARTRGWPSSWLNEGVSVYLSPDHRAGVSLYGEFPSPQRVGLRVYVAKPEYLLALKLRALRIGTRDVSDVLTLARHLDIRTLDGLLAVIGRTFPHEPLDARRRVLLADVVAELSS